MKSKRFLIIAALYIGVATLPMKLLGQSDAGEYFINPAMSLNIDLEKDTFIQWEPIVVHARFENRTDKALPTLTTSILSDGSIIIESGKEKREFGELSIVRRFLARQRVTLKPGEGLDEEFTLERALDEFFPKTGVYVIRIALNGKDGRRIVSNPVEVNIEKATGMDKEALEFIKRNKAHSRYPVLFTWDDEVRTEDGKTLLQEFVDKYSGSVYGDYAVYQLGVDFFVRREFDKAIIELDRVKNSSIPRIAKEARQTLSDAQKARGVQRKDS